MRIRIVWLLLSLAAIAGCTTSGDSPIITASFNSAFGIAGDAVTRTRPDVAGARWSSYAHEDLSDGQCYDLVVAPDGANRFMFFVDRLNDAPQRLYVRTGLGNTIWSSEDVYIDVPQTDYTCGQPRSAHIGNNRYVIVWLDDGDLHTALYDNNQPPGFQLTLGAVLEGQYADVQIRNLSVVSVDGEPRIIWSSADRQRILMRRGRVTSDVVTFDAGSRFFNIETTSNSDAIVVGNKTLIAVTDDTSIQLLSSTTNTTLFESVNQCTVTYEPEIAASLLYTTADGAPRTLIKSANVANGRTYMLDFNSCSAPEFQLPIAYGRVTHFRKE